MKVLVAGYYGFGNIGDEAVLKALVQEFRQREPGLEITVLSKNPRQTVVGYNVNAIGRNDLPGIIRAMRQTDVFVSGGGSLFQDVTSRRSFGYYIGLIMLAKLLGKKVMVLAQGFGPLNKKFDVKIAGLILNKVDLITVRDRDSLLKMRVAGVQNALLKLSADPVIKLGPSPAAVGKKILEKYGVEHKSLMGLSLRELPAQATDELVEKIAVGLKDFVQRHSLTPIFLPFKCPDDLAIAKKIAGRLEGEAIVIEEPLTVEEMQALIATLDILIGMRLHSLVLGLTNNVPLVGISYDPKVAAFMKELKQPCLGLEELDKIGAVAEGVIGRQEEIKGELAKSYQELEKRAEVSFALFFKEFAAKGGAR